MKRVGIIICSSVLIHDAIQLLKGGTYTLFGLVTALVAYVILDELIESVKVGK